MKSASMAFKEGGVWDIRWSIAHKQNTRNKMLNEKQDVPQRDSSKPLKLWLARHGASRQVLLLPDASSLTDDPQILLPTAEGDIDDTINCIVVYCW